MTPSQHEDPASNVRALVDDLLPVLLPGASVAPGRDEVLIPVSGGRARVSLTPLLHRCQDQPHHTWPQLLADWVAAIRRELPQDVDADDLGPVDVERLRVRLVPSAASAATSDYVALPFGEHFTATVVVNRPARLDVLTVAQSRQLGREPDDLFRLAMRQTVQHELAGLDLRDHELPGGGSVRLLAGDGNPFVTTTLLSLKRFLPDNATHGALVATPRYSAVMLHRVDARLHDNAVAFYRLASSMFSAADDPCSDTIFWWHDGELHPLRVVTADDGSALEVRVPEALTPVLNQLGDIR
ncbi:hypothetical protein [Couchioplanes azureus]|uniref:hypothetical protein n=1 Tax=Couchioplanes caeruleus TaxID=56438 RepID=UPI00167146DF|nr:hypothetical protein [Couchioplanes caeruleus]GGQ71376.1 hypothetical protein GCM10010166_46890 [Couchioplanes caeruleus subsp. azureus]